MNISALLPSYLHQFDCRMALAQKCEGVDKFKASIGIRSIATILFALVFPLMSAAQTPSQLAVTPLTNASNNALQSPDDPLPKQSLSKEVLNDLLHVDAAVREGDWQKAYVKLIALSHQTRDPRLAKRAVVIAVEAQQLEKALSAVRLWRELAPNSIEARQFHWHLLVIKTDLPELEKQLSAALLAATPTEQGPLIQSIQALFARDNNAQRAFQFLQKLFTALPESLDLHVALAQAAARAKENELALGHANKALALSPTSELAVLSFAKIAPIKEVIPQLRAFLQNSPRAHEVRIALASALIEQQQLDAAKAEFAELLALQNQVPNEHSATALYAMGAIELEQGQLDRAQAYFLSFLEQIKDKRIQHDDSKAYINLAQIALKKQDSQAADAWLAKLDYRDGQNPLWLNVQIKRAQLAGQAQSGDAIKKASAALRFLQSVPTRNEQEQLKLREAEILILRDSEQILEAFTLTQLSLRDHSDSQELLYHYAMLAEKLKRFDDMELALRQLIQVAPNNAFAYNALGYSLADRNIQLQEAKRLIDRANQLEPNNAYILDSLAWVQFRLKQFAEAEKNLRLALSLKQDLEIALHLAEVLWSQDQKRAASELISQLKKQYQLNPLIQAMVERLAIPE